MSIANKFRQSFNTDLSKNLLLWFPGHMAKGMKQMKQMLKDVDCVIEVHDSRIPLSGRNVMFQTDLFGIRPHLLVLNKCDLTDMSKKNDVVKALSSNGGVSNILYTDCRNPSGKGVDQIVPKVLDLMKGVNRFHRNAERAYNLLVIGVPNVGKSSLINVLRNLHTKRKNATQVGAIAGITRSVLHKISVCYDPPIYLLDTPGILEPSVSNVESALRLALCASIKDDIVGAHIIADYMLYWMNKHGAFRYVNKLDLDKPYDEITPLLADYAAKNRMYLKVKDHARGGYALVPDLNSAASSMLRQFRTGTFGKFLLDADMLGM